MRQNVKERLNKRLVENNMTALNIESPTQPQPEQLQQHKQVRQPLPKQLYDSEYNNRYDNYYSLQEPIYETRPTFLQSITPGNEQLIIVLLVGLAAYTLYLFSKSKDKS